VSKQGASVLVLDCVAGTSGIFIRLRGLIKSFWPPSLTLYRDFSPSQLSIVPTLPFSSGLVHKPFT
jgi:hypothetical protein